MGNKATLEKKMELARCIREENMGNRVKIRQREQILYGKNTQAPLYDKQTWSGQNDILSYGNPPENSEIPGASMSGFKYRMVLAVFLFVGFLVCDTNGSKIGAYSTNEVYDMILADTFHLYDTTQEQNQVLEELAGLLDFEH
ncbi:hypothetical protein D7V83_01320 [bacterium 0.1xD8-71]|nr:hypothetical protein D7V83_01320 [bacterium 0.1xD8-71]